MLFINQISTKGMFHIECMSHGLVKWLHSDEEVRQQVKKEENNCAFS